MRSSRDHDLVNLSLDGRQVVGVMVGTLVLLAVTFALGTTFGRRLASRQAEKPAALDPGTLDQMTAPPPTFAFGELLAKPDPTPVVEPPPKPRPAPRPAPVAAPEPAPAPEPEPAPAPETEPKPVFEPPPEAPAVEPAVHEAPAPAPAPVDALAKAVEKIEVAVAAPPAERPSGSWSVQFGASQDQAEADRLAAKLLGQGLTPFVVTAEIPGKGLFYRVRVGQFTDKQEADALLTRARSLGLQGLVMPVK